MEPPIRLVLPEDSPGLAALHARAFDTPWSESAIRALLASPGVWGPALADGSGFALVRTIADEAELLTLAVDPARRRRRLGRRLLAAAVAGAERGGAGVLHLEVAVDNEAAVAFYTGAGFTPAGRRRGYYARENGRVDALLMSRVLNSGAAQPYP